MKIKAPAVYTKVVKDLPRKISMRLEALSEAKKVIAVSSKATDRKK